MLVWCVDVARTSLPDPSLPDAARSLLPQSGTASSGHRAARTTSVTTVGIALSLLDIAGQT
ncbi:MAG: hypothetical protein V7K14_00875 [Nostoc sp.]|uniref:hypothetical protein n=1 Tax=Nostoc sp. TaxID=1180 RepID=UPI002FF8EE28